MNNKPIAPQAKLGFGCCLTLGLDISSHTQPSFLIVLAANGTSPVFHFPLCYSLPHFYSLPSAIARSTGGAKTDTGGKC